MGRRKKGIGAVFPIGAEIQVPGKTRNCDVFRLYYKIDIGTQTDVASTTSGLRTNTYNHDISI